MLSEEEIAVVTDQSSSTGIGVYARGVYNLLKGSLPNLRLYSFNPFGDHYDKGLVPSVLHGQKQASRLADVPWVTRENRRLARRTFISRGSKIHLCGADYSLADGCDHALCTVHDYGFAWPDLSGIRYFLGSVTIDARNLLLPKTLLRARAVLVDSLYVSAELKRKLGIPSIVRYPWVDQIRFKPRDKAQARAFLGLPPGKFLILNVSGGGSNKNYPLMRAIAKAVPEGSRVVKIGHPLDSPRALNIGRATSEVYPLYFNAADAYLHTSRSEGFGIPLVEAMASGLPVVALDATTAPEILGDAGVLIPPSEGGDSFLRAFKEIEVGNLGRDLVRKALSRLDRFSADSARKQLLQTYQRAFDL